MVMSVLAEEGPLQTNDIAARLGIKAPRTRQLLAQMASEGLIEAHGERKSRYYSLPQSPNEENA